jgi:hypothetical protein
MDTWLGSDDQVTGNATSQELGNNPRRELYTSSRNPFFSLSKLASTRLSVRRSACALLLKLKLNLKELLLDGPQHIEQIAVLIRP